jgi:hypothetical protein
VRPRSSLFAGRHQSRSSNTRKGDISDDPMTNGNIAIVNGGMITIIESSTSTAATTTAIPAPSKPRCCDDASGDVMDALRGGSANLPHRTGRRNAAGTLLDLARPHGTTLA